jgi:hypothetical protein
LRSADLSPGIRRPQCRTRWRAAWLDYPFTSGETATTDTGGRLASKPKTTILVENGSTKGSGCLRRPSSNAQDFKEVKALLSVTDVLRTPEETQTAVFSQGDTPVAIWNRVADDPTGEQQAAREDHDRVA